MERRACVHADERSGLVADERVPGLRLLRRAARGRVRRPASRSVDRHADAHATGGYPFGGVRLARRHETRAAVSERPARVLRGRGAGVRSRRAPADAGDRLVRSRHRHERLDVQRARLGSRLSAGSRQSVERRAARGNQGVPSLCRPRRRRNPVPHAARRASEGRVLRARLRSQRARALHGRLGRIPAGRRPAREKVANRGAARAEAHRPTRRESREVGAHRDWQLGRCDPRGAGPARAERHPRRLLPDTRLPVRRRGGASSSQQHERIFVVEQNRDAQLKSLLTIELGCDPARLHSILQYGGLPIDCRCVVDTLEQASARGEAA